jgi:ribosomal protein S18 acetylase RimI-like enzyme
MIIRDVRPDDYDDVARLLKEIGGDLGPGDERLVAGFRDFLEDDGTVLVAEVDSAIAGVCAYFTRRWSPADDSSAVWVDSLIVDERHRRQGIGRKLMEEVRRRARDAGCDSVNLDTEPDWKEALAFYEALGFKREAVTLTWPLRHSH